MEWDSLSLTRLIASARGDQPADLSIHNCRIVNVLSGRIESMDLAIKDGWITGLGSYEALEHIDAEGMYLCPGFIDGHIHIESSMLEPVQFCAGVLPWGTSAVVADPHEIANVLGLEGIRYFLDATRDLPLDVYFTLPSCVPASPLETSGARLQSTDLTRLFPNPRILGLAEMMNFPGVIQGSPDVLDKLVAFQDMVIDGHAPRLSGLPLNAYLAAGIGSDHECTDLSEAREKLAKGMMIMIREGSQSKDLSELLPLVDNHTWPQCMFVSDDRHPDDLLRDGHMNAIVNRAMSLGMEPVRAITLASWTSARYFRLHRQGAIAPGYKADFSLSPTLKPWNPRRVFKSGIEVAREGELLLDVATWQRLPVPPSPMKLSRLQAEDLHVAACPGRLMVIGAMEGTLLTRKIVAEPKIASGQVVADTSRDILKIAVYNRYVASQPPAIGFVQGFGLREGAIATTVAHDSHNLMVVGASDSAMVRVADCVRSSGGGMAIGGESGTVINLALPVAGLMSDLPLVDVVKMLEGLKSQAKALGCSLHNPFMALSFLALPVIPELKLTDQGLVDVTTFSVVPLFKP